MDTLRPSRTPIENKFDTFRVATCDHFSFVHVCVFSCSLTFLLLGLHATSLTSKLLSMWRKTILPLAQGRSSTLCPSVLWMALRWQGETDPPPVFNLWERSRFAGFRMLHTCAFRRVNSKSQALHGLRLGIVWNSKVL